MLDGEERDTSMIPVTPLVVGEVMSKDDAYYTPHKDNPFIAKFKVRFLSLGLSP